MARHQFTLTVNGDLYELLTSDQQTLLDVIRTEIGLTGTKRGCTTGACGVCTIHNADGESVLHGRCSDPHIVGGDRGPFGTEALEYFSVELCR
jgi:hypothetical protein